MDQKILRITPKLMLTLVCMIQLQLNNSRENIMAKEMY